MRKPGFRTDGGGGRHVGNAGVPPQLDIARKGMRLRERVDLRGAGGAAAGQDWGGLGPGSPWVQAPRASWFRQPNRLCHHALCGTWASVVDGDPSRPGNRGRAGRVGRVWARPSRMRQPLPCPTQTARVLAGRPGHCRRRHHRDLAPLEGPAHPMPVGGQANAVRTGCGLGPEATAKAPL
jgi:hypothetical protein